MELEEVKRSYRPTSRAKELEDNSSKATKVLALTPNRAKRSDNSF